MAFHKLVLVGFFVEIISFTCKLISVSLYSYGIIVLHKYYEQEKICIYV